MESGKREDEKEEKFGVLKQKSRRSDERRLGVLLGSS